MTNNIMLRKELQRGNIVKMGFTETQKLLKEVTENTQEVESTKKEVKKMERYSNSIGCHARYNNCTNEELKQIYSELNENDDDLIREVFDRIGWEYDKVFHIGEEDFNDNTLDIDKIVNNALNLL